MYVNFKAFNEYLSDQDCARRDGGTKVKHFSIFVGNFYKNNNNKKYIAKIIMNQTKFRINAKTMLSIMKISKLIEIL